MAAVNSHLWLSFLSLLLFVGANSFDVDHISEFIEVFELEMLFTSIQDTAKGDEMERDQILLDRSLQCLAAIQVLLVNSDIRSKTAICYPRHLASASGIRHLGIDIKYVGWTNRYNRKFYPGGRAMARLQSIAA